MQLELPPFSQFQPSLMLLLTMALMGAWGWSLWLLATGWSDVRRLPAWLWAVLLVVAPIVAAPVFLVIGAPSTTWGIRRAVAIAALAGTAVTTAVVAIQQIGIMDCGAAPEDPLTGVCYTEPHSDVLPVVLGILVATIVGLFVQRRWGKSQARPEPLAT